MKYTKELTEKLLHLYSIDTPVPQIAEILSAEVKEDVPERSIIAKLSSLRVYKKQEYLTKRGEIPVKKAEHIERIAILLDVNAEMLESLEKVNKSVLALLEMRLQPQTEELNIFKPV